MVPDSTTFRIPWIKYPIWDSLTTSRSLSITLNYIAILFEISYVFLLIFKKTRVVAGYLSLIFLPFSICYIKNRFHRTCWNINLINVYYKLRGVSNDKFLEIIGRKTNS